MAKRSQTTGLPKESPKQPPPKADAEQPEAGKLRLRAEYRSRAEREHEIQRWTIIGTGVVVAIALVILVVAIVSEQIIKPNQVVASVSGHNITMRDFQHRVRLERILRNSQLSNIINLYQSSGIDNNQILQFLQGQEPYKTWITELQVPDQMGLSVVNQLVEDQLVRIAADEKSVTVTQADIDKQINKFFGYDPEKLAAEAEATGEATAEVTPTVEPTITPTPYVSPTPSPVPTSTPTPEVTAEATQAVEATASPTSAPTLPPTPTLSLTEQADAFNSSRDDFFAQLRTQTGMSDGEIKNYFEIQALREALQEAVTTDITTTGTFVDARHILVASEEEANDVIAAIQGGESFAELAKAVSTDTGSGAQGGELGWNPATQYVAEFAEAVRTGEIGAVLGPIKTEFGYHIIQVRAREERDLTETQVTDAKASAFDTWLKDYKEAKKDQTQTFTNWSGNVPTDPASIFDQGQS